MGTEQEAVVRSLLVCLAAGDAERAADHYSEDASYSYPPWREPIVGRDAIRAALRKLFASCFAELRYTIVNIASTDAVVFTELADAYSRNGHDVTMHWSSVTEINENREITAQRDYFDTRELGA